MTSAVDWALKTSLLSICACFVVAAATTYHLFHLYVCARPDLTFAVDWESKTNYLSIYVYVYLKQTCMICMQVTVSVPLLQ